MSPRTTTKRWSRFSRTIRWSSSSSSASAIAGVVGNVYKGRVSKVLPGMQSAFVDLGLERDGFLYVTDVVSTDRAVRPARGRATPRPRCRRRAAAARSERRPSRRRRADAGDARPAPRTATTRTRRRGRRRAGADAVPEPCAPPSAATAVRRRRSGRARAAGRAPTGEPTIDQLLKEGQEVVVQVVKEPLGTKGARITCHASIPGPLPGLHADRRPRRRVAQDRVARRAGAAARHRPAVPRAAQLHRRASSSAPPRRAGPRPTSSAT